MVTCTVCELHAESTFKIEGMDCREEVALIERRFKHLKGLETFEADLMGQRLHVKYDAAKLTTSAIAAAVADAGMRAWLEHEEPVGVDDSQRTRESRLLMASGAAFGSGLVAGFFGAPSAVGQVLFAVSIAAAAPQTVRKAWHALHNRSLDINVLMLIAATGALLLNQWSEAAAVVFLFAIAEALEVRTLERARLAVRALMDLSPAEALLRDAHGERLVAVSSLAPGALIVIKPGEKIPLDGEVVAGISAVNQAPVTGESMPIDKGAGDEVFAGSINGRGALDVRVTRFQCDTTLARITHMVERAQAQRAPAQSLVERFASIYTPSVIGLAAFMALVPPLAFGADWHTWIYRALVLLVVSCPCALVISTPVSVVAALAAAARHGVLIKGGAYLEKAGRVRCVAFDKTGTLTYGAPHVVDVIALGQSSSSEVLTLASAIERRSDHPIAGAILRHTESLDLNVLFGQDVTALSGLGAEGWIDDARILLGNHRLFEERQLCSPALHTHLDGLSVRGLTAVIVARNDLVVGIIAVADRVRDSSRDTLDALRRHGVAALVMLTGDATGTATAIAKELGLDEFHAELMPADKVAAVEDLKRRFGSVAMVGDGVNDAPALVTADIGIAMGAAGSDVALETADIALMADELIKIPYTLRLSRAAVANIRANLAISLVMKAAFVVAAVTGVATLWMAILADTGASIIVVANAVRLLRQD